MDTSFELSDVKTYSQLLVIRKNCETACCGKPLRAQGTKADCESVSWPRIELEYGNNPWDWAIRMVTSYVRYDKHMEGRQRLNGSRHPVRV